MVRKFRLLLKQVDSPLFPALAAGLLLGTAFFAMAQVFESSHPSNLPMWLSIQSPAKERTNVKIAVHIPDGFTNRIEMFTCTNLIDFWWSLAATNLSAEGTNIIYWTYEISEDMGLIYLVGGNADQDSDGDHLPDAREKFLYHTSPINADTDGDGASDGDEIRVGTNPLNSPVDSDQDGLNDDVEIVLGTNFRKADSDGDGFSDYEEACLLHTNPNDPSDGRMLLQQARSKLLTYWSMIKSTPLVFTNAPGSTEDLEDMKTALEALSGMFYKPVME